MTPYPFTFPAPTDHTPIDPSPTIEPSSPAQGPQSRTLTYTLENVRGKHPVPQASHLRTLFQSSRDNSTTILAFPCTYDGLSSRLVAESGFPLIFLSGFAVSSAQGLPDTGYIALEDMCHKIQETARVVPPSMPIMVDGDTGYGSPMNVKRTVECFAAAGAAGVMIEDQTWPKQHTYSALAALPISIQTIHPSPLTQHRTTDHPSKSRKGCGHTKGKSTVSRGEAYARIQAAVDARTQGRDIFILARTDALIHGWDEAMTRAREFMRLGADAIFVEALPDRDAMRRCVQELSGVPLMANIIEGGKTENLSAAELARLGFAAVAYPWTLVAARLKATREALEGLKRSFGVGSPPMIMRYDEVCEGVGFRAYWDAETRYEFDEEGLVNPPREE
ncbi:isocitrate lyase/PEP mutase family protein [Aspergillus homomorphus CBS 101889]|uniref:PEP phosphonomutase n=1 Tax=Aspergillus homomorphus (strain CBS 101889) TaxID=1450537 RepID=A0A395I1A6_ASPHC|nr:PEP phosphonomutase [Aspergillus homomorphus CBS 101889]RAL13515.1 PEP phosphonomutase [Aspergillus homomorphus CBS 101889]